MKKLISAVAASVICLAPLMSQAAPFTLVAGDIYLQGNQTTLRSDGWAALADGSLLSYGGNQWVEYTVDLSAGNWDIGLDVLNQGNLGTGWYNQFVISSNFDGTSTVFTIPASSTDISNGYFNTDITTAGSYTVSYTWLNDQYLPGSANDGVTLDANIQIVGAFFHDPPVVTSPVPEPGTLLLLGSGLLGLGLMRKRKKNA